MLDVSKKYKMKQVSKVEFESLQSTTDKLGEHLKKLERFREEIAQKVCDDHYENVKQAQKINDIEIAFEMHNKDIGKIQIYLDRKVDSEVLEEELEELRSLAATRRPNSPNPI